MRASQIAVYCDAKPSAGSLAAVASLSYSARPSGVTSVGRNGEAANTGPGVNASSLKIVVEVNADGIRYTGAHSMRFASASSARNFAPGASTRTTRLEAAFN